jgi:hypothetical protein
MLVDMVLDSELKMRLKSAQISVQLTGEATLASPPFEHLWLERAKMPHKEHEKCLFCKIGRFMGAGFADSYLELFSPAKARFLSRYLYERSRHERYNLATLQSAYLGTTALTHTFEGVNSQFSA